ncbi:hypothetical protein Rhopal_003850-T1 [Rhodotorula paludigena]|uniref:Protein CPL1-like domain-containing protein n=1 Tax=Rhodotorula paludigena TaxID=86838 RepID=A0AAV5GMR8_9BASI|nr:hypothetical protein Rhopal_003850-T1 [Rhodotorula paludigena]
MQIWRFLPVIPLLFSGAAAQLLDLPLLDLGLLRNGALLDLSLVGNLLGGGDCTDATVGVSVGLLGLIRICACVNILQPAAGQSACPPCPANASPVCGEGICACACNAGFYRSSVGTCVPNSNCPPPNVLTQSGEFSVCTCATGFISDGAGGCVCPAGYVQSTTTGQCVLPPSGRARARHRRGLANKPHGRRGQQVFAPATSEGLVTKAHCPDGETACPLPSGGFECIDTTNSLTSCGGCVGAGGAGQNCLAIPGALHVECAASKCRVGSCFKGWRHVNDGSGRCV